MNKRTDRSNAFIFFIQFFAGVLLLIVSSCSKPSLETTYKNVAVKMNKDCPITIDEETRLDSVAALPSNTFGYYNTIVNMLKDSVDIEFAKNGIKGQIVNMVKTAPELKQFKNNNTTLEYTYFDKEGVFMFKVTATPEDYK